LRDTRHLLDVNVLIALIDKGHVHHQRVVNWFKTPGLEWGICPFTEAGFLRVATNRNAGDFTFPEVAEALDSLANLPGYSYWPIAVGWTTLAAPFRDRLIGHQQVTDAYLLGLAVREKGVLVTMDRAIEYLAGEQYRRNVLVLRTGLGIHA
jgi:uncharacterized protein